jgi:hypothetical protein
MIENKDFKIAENKYDIILDKLIKDTEQLEMSIELNNVIIDYIKKKNGTTKTNNRRRDPISKTHEDE